MRRFVIILLGFFCGFAVADPTPAFNDCFRTLLTMDERYHGEQFGTQQAAIVRKEKVTYLEPWEAELYEVQFENGLLVDRDSAPVTTKGENEMLVLGGNGKIYLGHSDNVDNHSSFVAGGPTYYPGEAGALNGMLIHASDRSGHYTPPIASTSDFLDYLQSEGVKVPRIKLTIEAPLSRISTDFMKITIPAETFQQAYAVSGDSDAKFVVELGKRITDPMQRAYLGLDAMGYRHYDQDVFALIVENYPVLSDDGKWKVHDRLRLIKDWQSVGSKVEDVITTLESLDRSAP